MAEPEFQDLIIVKRRLNTEPEMPKGGVWKIAFADFMTAMMCFFLVMWLINAANEDTRKAVASYFNPVRLAELNRKGLDNTHSPSDNQPLSGERTKEASTPGSAAEGQPSADIPRDALFKDPYKVLSEIAGGPPAAGSGSGSNGADVSAAGAGPFRDPFDPEFMTEPAQGQPAEMDSGAPAAPPPAMQEAGTPADQSLRLSLPAGESPPPPADSVPMSSETENGAPPPGDAPTSRSALQEAVSAAVKAETGSSHSPKVAVEQTGEGTVISLTDDAEFGMFGIGSAQPQPQMIRIMERIASILKARNGSITIRGHTDARPFKTPGYDNWRLSTDRAQMAYFMLVRGGLDEKRVAAIEGYADRKLKAPGDPEAAENRRIEILLREASP